MEKSPYLGLIGDVLESVLDEAMAVGVGWYGDDEGSGEARPPGFEEKGIRWRDAAPGGGAGRAGGVGRPDP